MDFIGCDLITGRRAPGIDLILPGFEPGAETVVIISPHDDDALLGAGLLIQAVRAAGANVKIIVVCDGRAGYSRIEDKPGIMARRKMETARAYAVLGLDSNDIVPLDVPDFSALHYLGWVLPDGSARLFGKIVPLLRRFRASRLLIPNGHREHLDHGAAHLAGLYFGPQAGDAVVAEWGQAPPVKSSLVYSVWADFAERESGGPRADRALLAPVEAEQKVLEALALFESQAGVIAGLVKSREERVRGRQALELYQSVDPRPRLDFAPYWEFIGSNELI